MSATGPSFVALDFETANKRSESACAIGVAVVRDGVLEQSFERLIRPPSADFSEWNFRVHGIHWNHVKNEPDFATVWSSIRPLVADAPYFVAHNAGFDQSVLMACCEYYNVAPPSQGFVCTIEAASSVWQLDSYKLSRLCQFLGIPLTHHRAQSDAEGCARVLLQAMRDGYCPGQRDAASAWVARHLCSEIMRLVADIVRDDRVEPSEIKAMASWLDRNPEACMVWPGAQLKALVDSILSDGLIDDAEREDFHDLCRTLLGLKERTKAQRPAIRKPGAASVCFTGFGQSSRKQELRAEAEAAGFHVTATVTKKLDYLVCGPVPGPSKLKVARERGVRCMDEQEWRTLLACGTAASVEAARDGLD